MQDRIDIKLVKGWLRYSKVFVYLGITFSDQGTIAEDIRLHVESRLQDMKKNNVDNSVETDEIIKQYQDARRKLNSEYYKQHENHYRNLFNSDERKLWSEINWSCNNTIYVGA